MIVATIYDHKNSNIQGVWNRGIIEVRADIKKQVVLPAWSNPYRIPIGVSLIIHEYNECDVLLQGLASAHTYKPYRAGKEFNLYAIPTHSTIIINPNQTVAYVQIVKM